MAFSSLDIIPSTVTGSLQYSSANNNYNDFNLKVSPVDSAGTKFDFTGATSAQVNLGFRAISGKLVQINLTTTMVAHDATGLTVRVTAGNLLAGLPPAASAASQYSMSITTSDGVNSIMAASGSAFTNVAP